MYLALIIAFFQINSIFGGVLFKDLQFITLKEEDGFIVKESYNRIRSRKDDFISQMIYERNLNSVSNEEFTHPKYNLKIAAELTKASNGYATYGHNKFNLISVNEFNARYLSKVNMYNSPDVEIRRFDNTTISSNIFKIHTKKGYHRRTLPSFFNWADHEVVTEIKDQGPCGSCWAFSVTGCMEGQYAIKNSNLLSFSEQEIIDCDNTDYRCNGGFPYKAIEKVKEMGGIESEHQYPYHPYSGCASTEYRIKKHDEEEMKKILFNIGPISIALNANNLQLYTGGIHNPEYCTETYLNHAVLIVGYGSEIIDGKSVDYWIVKNSWGADWGEKGYFRILRGDNRCGITEMALMVIME
ncbi:hypothetical protein A3Q56_01323 [Intoshia linei]|uniref:Peptidase C1A papain C-terminal domain-containing protein n=1 Tax=Intoshia linei TaxID=1819745 RepID=A0A177B9N6_9BILA|nr:hypothetical protein A3Q56_01323 [Intoshia linei]